MRNSDKRRPYIRASLVIRGGDDPAMLSQRLNVKPDESYRKGTLIPVPTDAKYKIKKARIYSTSIWKLNARLKRYSFDVEDYVKDILRRVHRVSKKISALDRRRFNVTLDVSLDLLTDASAAANGLSNESLGSLARLGASFDVDAHVWTDLPPYAKEGLSRFKK